MVQRTGRASPRSVATFATPQLGADGTTGSDDGQRAREAGGDLDPRVGHDHRVDDATIGATNPIVDGAVLPLPVGHMPSLGEAEPCRT